MLASASEHAGVAAIPVYPNYYPIEFAVLLPGPTTYKETDHQFLPAPAPLWNPWLDLRVDARFRRLSQVTWIDVPGFFAGDGSVGDVPGRTCKVRFTPSGATGTWVYEIKVWRGLDVNVSQPGAVTGATLLFTDGGAFVTVPAAMSAPGFQRQGPLRYVGEYRYQFENGEYFLKTGSGGPENFLAYREFTDWASHNELQPPALTHLVTCEIPMPNPYPYTCNNTNNNWKVGGVRETHRANSGHQYLDHFLDWTSGDPTWEVQGQVDLGKEIIGALNDLSDRGINSLYMLLMNLGGDSRDVAPFANIGSDACSPQYTPDPLNTTIFYNRTLNYSVARMREWNIVFEHAMRKGIALDLVLSELELSNINWLGGASMSSVSGSDAMTRERKLFLKQMVAMFGHNHAIKWVLQEENIDFRPPPVPPSIPILNPGSCHPPGFTRAELQEMAEWIGAWDAYDHPITVHTTGFPWTPYHRILTDASYSGWLGGTSLQVGGERPINPYFTPSTFSTNYNWMPRWVRGVFAGQPVPIDVDENGHAFWGASRDGGSGYQGGVANWNDANDRRRRVLYDVLFAGAGLSLYYGGYPITDPAGGQPLGGDHSIENFESRAELFTYMKIARNLITIYPGTQTPRPNWWTYRPWDSGNDSIVEMSCQPTVFDDITVGFSAPFWTMNPFVDFANDIGAFLPSLRDLTDTNACDITYGKPRAFAQQDGDALIYYPSLHTSPNSGTIRMDRTWSTTAPPGPLYAARWFNPVTGAFNAMLPHSFYGNQPQVLTQLPQPTNQDWVLVIERVEGGAE